MPTDAPIFRCISVQPDGVWTLDLIHYEGEFWLVPEWDDNKIEGWSAPARIVRLGSLPHTIHLGKPIGDASVLAGAPRESVFGPYPSQMLQRGDLVEAPDIRYVRKVQ
jgi:hypothetical protein